MHLHEARKQRLVSQPLDGVPDVVPTHLPVSFGLRDDPQRARQSRVAANLILEKYGIR